MGEIILAKLMSRLYGNIDDAKAFVLSFTNFAYFYDDVNPWDFRTEICHECRRFFQSKDFLAPRASCKKPTSILHSLDMGVSKELRDDLIARFDITEDDFRPVRNKKGEIVYYQITPQHVMLPIHAENEWKVKMVCSKCGSIQYDLRDFLNEKREPYYLISQVTLDDIHDLNVTYEQFRWGVPMVVISRRVYDYLTECYPRTHYFPLFLK